MLKKIAIAAVVIVVILVVGLLAVAALVDVDHYKPQIEKTVHDKTGRTLKIDGKLTLSVFPTIALALPRMTLSEHGSDDIFLSLDTARVSLALPPLLSGKVQASTVTLHGLHATVDRHADGSLNIDDLTGGRKEKEAATASEAAPGKIPDFAIGGIDVADAQVIYRDEKARNTVTLSRLNLKTGRLAPRTSTPLDFSASVDATSPKAHVDLSLKTRLDLDLDKKSVAAHGLDAKVKGNVADDQLDVALTAPEVELGGERTSADAVKLVALVSGAHQAKLQLALDKLAGDADKVSAAKLALDVEAAQGPQNVAVHLASPLQAGIAAQSVELPKLSGDVSLQSPTLPQKALKIALDGSAKVEAKAQNAAAQLKAKFDDTALNGRFAVQGFGAPHIAFDVDIDQLNLDKYLPPSQPAAGGAKPAGTGAGGAGPAGAEADPKVDLSALKPLNLAGSVKIGALQIHNLKAAKVDVGVHAASGHLEVSPLAANLYEGKLGGSVKVDADTNRVAPNLALDGISIEPLLKDFMGKDILEGHGNVKLDVAMQGPTVGAMKRALNGSASLNLKDGAVHGINLAQKIRDFKSALGGGSAQTQTADASQKTDFSEMSASFQIRNGVASNNDLTAKSPLLRLGGAGTIDIGGSSIDYTAKVSVVGTLSGQGGGDLSSLKGVTIPVHLSGPFTSLSYQLDWGSIATQELKNKAADKVNQLLGGKLKQGGSSPNVGDALKGLLGK